jgi:hypothetical protein
LYLLKHIVWMGHLLWKTHINTFKSIKFLVQYRSPYVCLTSVTINTHIKIMGTQRVIHIPSTVTAFPYEWFITSALDVVKHYWTTSCTIGVAILHYRARSSEIQLTTYNLTFYLSPAVITTDSTPAKRRMVYFNSSCFVAVWVDQPDL